MKARTESLRYALLLLVVVVVTHYDVVFLGRSLINSNFFNPIDHRYAAVNYGPDFVSPDEWTRRKLWTYANLRDPGAVWWQWEPGTQFLKQAIANREWPFWDPYIGGGTPAMANLVSAFFFPPYLAVVLLGGSPVLLNAYFLCLVWGAGFFTFLFVRQHDIDCLPAVSAGTAVILGGASHQFVGSFIGQTAACLPLVLFATRWFLDHPSPTRAAGMACVYAVAALASFAPLLVAIFGFALIYTAFALQIEHSLNRRPVVLWLTGVATSVGLVAWYYLPALALRAATPQMQQHYAGAALETMPYMALFQLVSPTLAGGVQTYIPAPPLGGGYVPNIGIIPVALACIARSGSRRRRTLLLASAVSVGAILLKLVGFPLVQWTGTLPLVREIHLASYFGIAAGFLLAFLASLGMQGLIDARVGRNWLVAVAGATLMVPVSLWLNAQRAGVATSGIGPEWTRDWRMLGGCALAGAALLLAARGRRPRGRWIASGSLLLVLVTDSLYAGWYPNPARWDIFRQPAPYVQRLAHEPGLTRIMSFGAPSANLNSAFAISSMDSLMAFNPPRAFAMYRMYAGGKTEVFMREARRLPPEVVLDRANIGLVSVNQYWSDVVRDAQSRGYTTIFDDGFVIIMKRRTSPRFFFSTAYRVVGPAESLGAIATGDASTIVLEQSPGFPSAENGAGDARVRVTWYRYNSIGLAVEAPTPGLLYAAESFFAGWGATVNDNRADIVPANHAFRAVVVPAGQSTVEFTYWPPGLTAGLWLTAASVLGLFVLSGATRASRARRA